MDALGFVVMAIGATLLYYAVKGKPPWQTFQMAVAAPASG